MPTVEALHDHSARLHLASTDGSASALPRDLEAEQRVLGSVLLEPKALDRALTIVAPNDFCRSEHRTIMQAVLRCHRRQEPVGLTTVGAELRRNGDLEAVGGGTYLTALTSQAPTIAQVALYASIVAEKAALRHLEGAERRTQKPPASNPQDMRAAVERADAIAIPRQLTALRRWVVHRAKAPYQTGGRLASTTNPATWTTFDLAVAGLLGFDGLGFVLGEGICGVDLDHCRDGDGSLRPWAAEIVARLDSYTEVSPSGTGLHVLLQAVLPGPSRKTPDVEVYGGERYFTVTGEHLCGTPATVEKRQVQLAEWYRERFPLEASGARAQAPSVDLTATDGDLLRAAFSATNGGTIRALFDEPGAPGNSEGDAALAGKLAFYSGGDPARLERMVRASNRYRAKWDTRRGSETWIAAECRRAVARHVGDWFTPRRGAQAGGGARYVTGHAAYPVG